MGSGNEKLNIFLKKFITQQDITTNFLDYLHNLIIETHTKLVPIAGIYSYPVTGTSTVVDTISFLTPGETLVNDGNGPQLEGNDGHGRILKLLNSRRENVPIPNENGVKYHCGIRFNYYPNETEINVRTGKIKWSLFREAIGERAEPNVVSYYSSQLTMKVDSVCGDVDQVGRTVRVWLKVPISQATGDVFEDVVISKQNISFLHDGGANFLDVPNELKGYFSNGQTLTVDKTITSPQVTTVSSIGADDSGGVGFTRVNVAHDLSGYTVVNGGYVLTGNNIVNLVGSLGQGALSSVDSTDYEVFMYGISITTNDLRNDEYYAYLLNYTGQGAGNNPSLFDNSDQKEIPSDIGSLLIGLDKFKEYQLQRNGFIFRGGGQFSFNSGTLEWGDEFQIVNPFRGIYRIAASSIASIVDDNVLYTKIYKEKPAIISGNASGEIWLDDTTDLNDNDKVIFGDNDSAKGTGFIFGTPGVEKIIIDDGAGTPLDLSTFLTTKGAWVQRVNTSLLKGTINEGDLRPSVNFDINETVMIVAVASNGVLVFKNGVLRLEDGDVGQISNLPSNFNWINTDTELKDSITKSGDGNVGILAPRTYTLSAKLSYNKNLSWAGITEQTIISGNFADPLIEIVPDPSTSGTYQSVEFKNLTLKNLGAGNVLQIDNTGATKGMEIVLDSCILLASSGLSINIIHGEPGQWIKLKFLNSKKELNTGSMVLQSKNNSDDYIVSNVLMSANDSITFGEGTTNPTSNLQVLDSKVDQIIALGSGNAKTIKVQDSYSWDANKKIELVGTTLADFQVSQVIVDLIDFESYQKARNGILIKLGAPFTLAAGTFTWGGAFEFRDSFYGAAIIAASNIGSVADKDIFYTKIYKTQLTKIDGNASGEVDVPDSSVFSDNDKVIIGDNDSNMIEGFIFGAPVGDQIVIDDGAGTPIDISSMTVANGAWVRKVNLTLSKNQANLGDLKPSIIGELDEEVFIIGYNDNGTIRFSDGTDTGYILLNEILDTVARPKFGSVANEELDNETTLHHDKHDFPLDTSLTGDVITIEAATKQKLESDSADGTQNAYKWRTALIGNLEIDPAESSIDLSDGSVTGDFDSPATSFSMTASYYIQMGIELRTDGKYYIVWGDEGVSAGVATPPTFSGSGVLKQILIVKLQDNGSGGVWNFNTPSKSDIEIIKIDGSLGGGGGGAGSKSIYAILDAETDNIAANWTKDNNATLGTAGAGLAGTLEITETDPINETKHYKYTQAAGSLNDWWISPEQDLPKRSKGKFNAIRSPFLYDGADDDISCYIRYFDGSWKLGREIKIENQETITGTLLPTDNIPSTATKIAFAFHVKALNSGKILEWDDSEFTDDPFIYKDIIDQQEITLGDGNGHGSSSTKIRRFTTTVRSEGSGILSDSGDSSTLGREFTALKRCLVNVSYVDSAAAGSVFLGISKNSNQLTTSINSITKAHRKVLGLSSAATSPESVSWSGVLEVGDVIRFHGDGFADATTHAHCSITAIAQTEHIVTPATSNFTNWEAFTPTGSWTTNTTYTGFKRRVGDSIELNIQIELTGAPGGAASLEINYPAGIVPDTNKMHLNLDNYSLGVGSIWDSGTDQHLISGIRSTSETYVNPYTADGDGTISGISNTNPIVFASGDQLNFRYLVPVVGWSSDLNFLAGIPFNKWQTKILSADVTSDGVISDLTFNNLVIGRTYRVCGQISFEVLLAGTDLVFANIINGAQDIATSAAATEIGGKIAAGINAIFIATATSLTCSASSASPTTSRIEGNGTRTQTFIQLEELTSHSETAIY